MQTLLEKYCKTKESIFTFIYNKTERTKWKF